MAILVQAGERCRADVIQDSADGGSEASIASATVGNAANLVTGDAGSPQVCQDTVTECQLARLRALNEECKRMILVERERLAQCRAKLEAVLDAYYATGCSSLY